MKTINIALFITAIIFVSCDRDSSNTGTRKNPLGNIIEEQLISSDGGVISTPKLTVEIPENTFTETVEISVSVNSSNTFGAEQLSNIYFVNNIPPVFNAPITIRLNSVPQSDDLKMFIVEQNYVRGTHTEELSYRPADYTFEGEEVVVVLPANNGSLKTTGAKSAFSTDGAFSVGVLAVGGYSTLVSSGRNFQLTFPSASIAEAEDLADYLEEAFGRFSGTNFGFSYAGRTSWPVEVVVKPLANTVYGYMTASVWGDNYASLEFNSNKISDSESMRLTAGHEFMHFVQNLYDPRNRFSKAKFAAPHLWVDEGVAVWAEEFFTDQSGYTSSIRAGHQMAPFSGMLKGAESDAADHGYGMSALFKYIAGEYGTSSIKTIYENIAKGENADKAIGAATNTDYASWYGVFLQKYAAGELYSDVAVNTWIGNKSGDFAIRSSNDTLKEFKSNFAELAGKFYTISIEPDAVKDESALEISVKQGYNGKVCAYKYSASTFERIGYVASTVTVAEIKAIAQSGQKILVLASNLDNSYATNDENELTLQFKVVNNKTTFTKVSFDFDVMSTNIISYETGSSSTGQNRYYYSLPEVPAVQNGNVITASWNGVYYYQRQGSATITFDGNKIVSYEINDVISYNTSTETIVITGTNMPLAGENVFGLSFSAPSSCTSVTEYYSFTQYTGFSEETTGFFCDPQYGNDSFINLRY
ncbi:MAG: hypothetical protein JXB34_14260 [Bacteroidales bacterium]|nr:hypothetical protein [Bacteroidales bacterium]